MAFLSDAADSRRVEEFHPASRIHEPPAPGSNAVIGGFRRQIADRPSPVSEMRRALDGLAGKALLPASTRTSSQFSTGIGGHSRASSSAKGVVRLGDVEDPLAVVRQGMSGSRSRDRPAP